MIDPARWAEWLEPPRSVRSSSIRATGCRGIYLPGPRSSGVPTQMFAWVGMPAMIAEQVPAVVLVHGGGGSADASWVLQWTARGYAAIAVDTNGQLPVGRYGQWRRNPAGGPGVSGGFDQVGRPLTEQWGFHAVAAVLAAISQLEATPGVDPSRIGVIGISWGGHIACLVAGIDARPSCIVSVYGAGFTDRSPMFTAELARLSRRDRTQWLDRWDPRWYLEAITTPMLFASGTNDTAWDLTSLCDSAALPKVPATLSIRPGLPHDHRTGTAIPECPRFVDRHLLGGPPLPHLAEAKIIGTAITSVVPNCGDRVTQARLCATVGQGSWLDRQWVTTPATMRGGRISAELPGGATAAFLAVEVDDGSQFTTSMCQLAMTR